jgi:hypothetical protein
VINNHDLPENITHKTANYSRNKHGAGSTGAEILLLPLLNNVNSTLGPLTRTLLTCL